MFLVSLVLGHADISTPKTRIVGDRVNVLRRGERVEFVGHVRMWRGSDTMTADRMVQDETTRQTQAWGQVHLSREDGQAGVVWEAWGDEGLYEERASSGTLWGVGRMARAQRRPFSEPSSDLLAITAEVLTLWTSTATSWDGRGREASMAQARRQVILSVEQSTPTPRFTQVWAESLTFDGTTGTVRAVDGSLWPPESRPSPVFEGLLAPRAHMVEKGERRWVTGDEILYSMRDKRLIIQGTVRSLWWPASQREN